MPESRIIHILNGPNLNLLGKLDPSLYGKHTLSQVERMCNEAARRYKFEIKFYQSNDEGVLVDYIQSACESSPAGLIINAMAYAYTSISLRDAIIFCPFPVIELHINNPHKQDGFNHRSYLSAAARGVIYGFGSTGYSLAIAALARLTHNARQGAGNSGASRYLTPRQEEDHEQ